MSGCGRDRRFPMAVLPSRESSRRLSLRVPSSAFSVPSPPLSRGCCKRGEAGAFQGRTPSTCLRAETCDSGSLFKARLILADETRSVGDQASTVRRNRFPAFRFQGCRCRSLIPDCGLRGSRMVLRLSHSGIRRCRERLFLRWVSSV